MSADIITELLHLLITKLMSLQVHEFLRKMFHPSSRPLIMTQC